MHNDGSLLHKAKMLGNFLIKKKKKENFNLLEREIFEPILTWIIILSAEI